MSSAERSNPGNHLSYEISMLFSTADLLKEGDYGTVSSDAQGDVLKNAVLESFLVHTRNVIDFLWKKGYKDDIVSSFFCSSEWSRADKISNDKISGYSIDKFEKMIHKQIAHLTVRRTQENGKTSWQFVKISCDIAGFIAEFLKEADKLGQSYKSSIEKSINQFKAKYCDNNNTSVHTYTTTATSTTYVIVSDSPDHWNER